VKDKRQSHLEVHLVHDEHAVDELLVGGPPERYHTVPGDYGTCILLIIMTEPQVAGIALLGFVNMLYFIKINSGIFSQKRKEVF